MSDEDAGCVDLLADCSMDWYPGVATGGEPARPAPAVAGRPGPLGDYSAANMADCRTPEEVFVKSGVFERVAEKKRREAPAAAGAAPAPAPAVGPAVADLPELPPEAEAAIRKAIPGKRHASHKPVAVGQIPKPLPENENPAALFKNGWLRKGGGAFLVAPSGVGKSTISMQAAFMWALGREFFGICPVRPIRSMIIQAEDDRDEIAFFRDCISHGLINEFGVNEDDLKFALGSEDGSTALVRTYKIVGKVGQEFVDELGAIMDDYPEVDLFIINPFQSYFGGDCSKNVELSQFLRVWLDREIKDPADEGKDRAAVLFVHHTNKPPSKDDERALWGVDQFAAYIGAGGAEMVNWARAILSLMPTKVEGVYRLCAGKRGQRLGWIDTSTGKKTRCKIIKHAEEEHVYWRPGDDLDDAELEEAERPASRRQGARGAVGGSGGGGRPPTPEPKFNPILAVNAVDTYPGLSGNEYRKKIVALTAANNPRGEGCCDATAKCLLAKAVRNGWLSCTKVLGCNRYEVTQEGKANLELKF